MSQFQSPLVVSEGSTQTGELPSATLAWVEWGGSFEELCPIVRRGL